MIFVVNRADDGLNGALDGVDAGLQRARVLLGVSVESRGVHQRVQGRDLHEVEVLERLLLLAPSLQNQIQTNQSQTHAQWKKRIIRN